MIEQATEPAPSILIIDDGSLLGEQCLRLLRRDSWQVSRALGWWAGIRRAAASNPDLVIIDAGLRDVDGLSVLALLQADPATAGLRVLLISSRADPELWSRARRLGALAVLASGELTPDRLALYAGRALVR